MRLPLAATATLIVALLGLSALADQSRDAGIQSPSVASTGTAVLSGRLVTEADASQGVRRAVMRLTAANLSDRLVGTDDAGWFSFVGLPAGSYTLSATKAGYVDTFYGSKRPGRGPGVPIAVGNGARVDVTLIISKGAAISGTVRNPNGNPASGVSITAIALGQSGAKTTRAVTDDRGIYRVFGLPAGDYVITATATLGAATALAMNEDEARWVRAQLAAGMSAAEPTPPPAAARRALTFAPVFFPGTTNAGAAARVTLAEGQELSDISFAVQLVPAVKLAGSVIDPDGQPTTATVSLYPKKVDQSAMLDLLIASGALTLPTAQAPQGVFSMNAVPSGEYTMVARSGGVARRGTGPAPNAPPAMWSISDFTVGSEDQTGIVVRLLPGMRVTGSVGFESTTLPAPTDFSAIQVSLSTTGSLVAPPASPFAAVAADKTFRFASVLPGAYTVGAVPPPGSGNGRWILKSAMWNGRDLADQPVEMKPGEDMSGVVVTFTDRISEISGRLVDSSGRPLTRYSIVVFPADRTRWIPNPRRIQSVSPATDGSFKIAGLPAGEYAIAAAADVEAIDLSDPAFLSQLLAVSIKIPLSDGEKRVQNLRVGG